MTAPMLSKEDKEFAIGIAGFNNPKEIISNWENVKETILLIRIVLQTFWNLRVYCTITHTFHYRLYPPMEK